MRFFLTCIVALAAFWPSVVCADLLLYPLPGSKVAITLQGEVTANPGGTLTFRHPRMGRLYFRIKDVRWFKAPPLTVTAKRQLQKAVKAEDVDGCLEAASWALHQGLLPQFYDAASAAWRLSRDHPTVQRLAALKQKMDAPVTFSKSHEAELRKFARSARRMQFARSKHFLLLHDTPPTPEGKSKQTRAQRRLELLETVYESFMLKFCLAGVELEVPKEPLKVVLFAHKDDFSRFSEGLKPELSKAAGFYSKKDNTSVFYDQGTNELYSLLDKLNEKLKTTGNPGLETADWIRFVNTFDLLTSVAKENADIEVVSHEATHHMAGATGLMPNDAQVPVWAAEGLATYFESPKEASWSGIGSVNEERLDWYRELADDREHSNIDFIVSDKIFVHAKTMEALLHGYGQSWALTHFLMERHPEKLIEYYRIAAKLHSEERVSPEENLAAFNKVFGSERAALEVEWHAYMRDLKTDVEAVLGR